MGADKYLKYIQTIRLDLLELFGNGYVIDHCIALLKKEREERIYRVYITDGLKAISETLQSIRGSGSALSVRWLDLVEKKDKELNMKIWGEDKEDKPVEVNDTDAAEEDEE